MDDSSESSQLLAACQSAFTGRSIRLGRKLFEGGLVYIEGADEHTVIVRVQDEEASYMLGYSFADVSTHTRLQVHCECRFFQGGFRCPHLYAGLLAIEASGLNMVAPHYLDQPLDLVVMKEDLRVGRDRFFQAGQGEPAPAIEIDWRQQITALRRTGNGASKSELQTLIARGGSQPLHYHLLTHASEERQALTLAVEMPEFQGPPSPFVLDDDADLRLSNATDAALIGLLVPCRQDAESNLAVLPRFWRDSLLDKLLGTGRCFLKSDDDLAETTPLEADTEVPWQASLTVVEDDEGQWLIHAEFHRDDERLMAQDPDLVLPDGLMVADGKVSKLATDKSLGWLRYLRRASTIRIPESDQLEAVRELLRIPGFTKVSLPEPWIFLSSEPGKQVRFEPDRNKKTSFFAEVSFVYDGVNLSFGSAATGYVDEFQKAIHLRDTKFEEEAILRLGALGGRIESGSSRVSFEVEAMNHAIRRLTQEGWSVFADGIRLRNLSGSSVELKTDQDWFELEGLFDFEGQQVDLPALLQGVSELGYVELSDGSHGMLPEDWLTRYEALTRLGKKKGKKLRFHQSQGLMLESLIHEHEGLQLNQDLHNLRVNLANLGGIVAQTEPPSFQGELRQYQREGVGWLAYLAKLGLNGCLADDMGLGKTVQLLAWFESRREAGEMKQPCLVVAPRSLVYNWHQEAERFVPGMRVLSYIGPQRELLQPDFGDYDLILTTYGIARRDADFLTAIAFDYVVLDEAQAIKNPSSQVSRACRALVGKHRLTLSGTPIENRVTELWSLFEFLNPGMLGSRAEFAKLAHPDRQDALSMVGRALAPMILRRRKNEVLSELPEKTELTLFADLSEGEQELYDELKAHYQQRLSQHFEQSGFERSQIHVLEALLRLRQAACHPGLVDKSRARRSSAKLDLLSQQLEEITAEGHKVLVFSQFVQLLEIFKAKLDAQNEPYAYLDGRTIDREGEIKRFTQDPDCKLFLISLRAGGVGLNLTAADYVFILDPWWNPAVEAQAIDRAHRIGQARPVFAYRIIARGTVEEKILDLQRQKTRLVDAILGETGGGLRELTREDLDLLLA